MAQVPLPTNLERHLAVPEENRFSDQQAAEILKRAAELQCSQTSSTKKKPSTGFSLSDLEVAARESGLDPKLVRQAALELSSAPKPKKKDSPWTGGPTSVFIEQWIEEEISESAYPEIVAELCRDFGDPGTSSVLGNSLTWMPTPMYQGQRRNVHVMISPKNGRTLIRIQENFSSLAGRIFGGVLGGVGGGGLGLVIPFTAILRMPGMIPLAALIWIGIWYQICRKLFRTQVEKYEQANREIAKQLALRFSQNGSNSNYLDSDKTLSPSSSR